MKTTIGILPRNRRHYDYDGDEISLMELFGEVYNDIAWNLSELDLRPEVVIPVVHTPADKRPYLYDEISDYLAPSRFPATAVEFVAKSLGAEDLPGFYDMAPIDGCPDFSLRFDLYNGIVDKEILLEAREVPDGHIVVTRLHADSSEMIGMQPIIKALIQREKENLE